MIWRIPVRWMMTGIQEVRAEKLKDAMEHACDIFDPVDSEFYNGSLVVDCDDIESVRFNYNRGRPDGVEITYPELKYYDENNERDLCWDGDESDYDDIRETRCSRGMLQYRIIFEAGGERFYCNVEALTLCEAIGSFLREHPHITYNMIIDHMEV